MRNKVIKTGDPPGNRHITMQKGSFSFDHTHRLCHQIHWQRHFHARMNEFLKVSPGMDRCRHTKSSGRQSSNDLFRVSCQLVKRYRHHDLLPDVINGHQINAHVVLFVFRAASGAWDYGSGTDMYNLFPSGEKATRAPVIVARRKSRCTSVLQRFIFIQFNLYCIVKNFCRTRLIKRLFRKKLTK